MSLKNEMSFVPDLVQLQTLSVAGKMNLPQIGEQVEETLNFDRVQMEVR